MSFLAGVLIFFGSIWLIFRLFGKQIMRFALRKAVDKIQKDMENQTRQYQQNYGQDPYHNNHRVNDEVEIKIPKQQAGSTGPSLEDIAEDVEFEEIADEKIR